MSNRLTFSLASLIVIFALGIAATPVMAAPGGPTVTFSEYSGVENVGADPTTQTAMHTQARDDFRVLLTFSAPVDAPTTTNVNFRAMDTSTGRYSDVTTVSVNALFGTTNRFVAAVDVGGILITKVEISIAEDAVLGNTGANLLGNVGNSHVFNTPTVINATVQFGIVKPHATDIGTYMVDVVFTNKTAAAAAGENNTPPAVDSPAPASTNELTANYIDVTPATGAVVTVPAAGIHVAYAGATAADVGKKGTSTYTLTVKVYRNVNTVELSVDPGYATAASTMGTVMVPTRPAKPANLKATAETTATAGERVKLTWTKVTGATYEYRYKLTKDLPFSDGDSDDEDAWMNVPAANAGNLLVLNLTAGENHTFQVRVKETGTTPASMVASASATPSRSSPEGEVTIPKNGYVAVVRDMMDNHLGSNTLYVGAFSVTSTAINIQEWAKMPDLATLFTRTPPGLGGGALTISKSSAHTANDGKIDAGTVGISEIMWAWDEGSVFGEQRNEKHTQEQWIELHNTNNFEVKVILKAYNATQHRLQALNPQSGEIDRVSNFNVNNVWDVKGQSGDSALGKDFVSMFRAKNANRYNHGDNNGRNGGKWSASAFVYLRAVSSRPDSHLTKKLVYDFKGTPGRSNTIPSQGVPTKTNVPNSPIIFNEVANLRDQTLEWIELKNVSDKDVDLRNYEITLVTGVNQEKRLFHFNYGDNHVIIKKGDVLLLVDTDPRYNDDHPIAVGYNVRGGNDQALGIGNPPRDNVPRYLVTNFAEGGLPDSGEFVLVLRTSKPDENYEDNKGKEGRVSDAVGYHPNLKSTGDPLYTNLWPLKVFGAPNKSRNKIELETVHYRRKADADPDQGDNNKPEQIALNNAGYTGVGYKRFASRHNPAHYGTPGYDHSGLIQNDRPGTGGVVTISEIMFDQGDALYPQWIELYNSSDKPVNLHAGDHGWRLVIENFDNGTIPINRLSGTLNFRSSDVQTILPKQTVLVTSTRARSSGSAYFDTSVIFPPTRVFSVWDDARGELGQTRSTDPILSTQGFYIELIDGKNRVSDSVGNLIDSPNRRVAAKIAWPLSDITGEMMDDGMMDDEPRSSIMRRYRKPSGGTFRDPVTNEVEWPMYTAAELEHTGITVEGWVLASNTHFRGVSETWYGHRGDVGSPGITTGRVLPVELSTFRPVRLDDGSVAIRWITESEKDNAGFNILRSDKRYGEFTKLNTQLIAGQGTTSERTVYEFVDKTAKPNVIYYYQIQDVSLDGDVQILKVTHLRGHVSAAGKATTTWGRLKALQ